MAFSEFSDFGFLEFGNDDPTDAEQIYNQLVTAMGNAFDLTPGTYQEAKLYATAMLFGEAVMTLERARGQRLASRVSDLLDERERDYGIISQPSDSADVRRARLMAREMLMRGAREEAIVTELRSVLGADFIALRTTKAADRLVWPTDPRGVGTFPPPDRTPKFLQLADAVLPGLAWARFTKLNGSAVPFVGEKLTVEPELSNPWAEMVQVVKVSLPGSSDFATYGDAFQGYFQNPHSAGGMMTNHSPIWVSNQREIRIILSAAAARDPEKRRLVHEAMSRHMKTVSRWTIQESADGTTCGPFIVGTSKVGSVPIGPAAVAF